MRLFLFIFTIAFFLSSDFAFSNQRDKDKQKIEDTIEQGSGDFDIKDNAVITGSLKVDTINEEQSGVGVTIDGVTIKDGEITSKSNFGIGSIQQSILTEAQFQAVNGTEWVKIKGQAILGSKLCTLYSICNLPSAEGRYLRDSVSDTGLGTLQAQDTKLNGIALGGTTTFATSVNTFTNPTMPKHYHSATSSASNDLEADGQSYTGNSTSVQNITHSHYTVYNDINNAGVLDLTSEAIATESGDPIGGHTQFPNVGRTSENIHTHTVAISHTHGSSAVSGYAGCQGVSGCVDGDTNTQTTGGGVTLNTSSISLTGDGTETRPNSLIVNTFIKIN